MDFDEYETLPTKNFAVHMTAGAIAGILEHCIMYPCDSIKTKMQSLSPQINSSNTIREVALVIKKEGKKLYKGVSVVVAGAGPAHAMYFSVYEHLKDQLQKTSNKSTNVATGLSAMVATLFHDGLMTPTEVVKQRLQMCNSPYKSVLDCISRTYKSEGIKAFYRSYTTQLAMNIPFQIIHFMTYERCQNLTNKDRVYNPLAHVTSGAVAGAVAAAVTTPLDVVKTLLNTQQVKVKGILAGIKTVYTVSGIWGFCKGLYPRVMYQMPSTAICWSVYELFKYILSRQAYEIKCNNKSLTPIVLVSDRQRSAKLRPVLLLPEVNLESIRPLEENDRFDNNVTAGSNEPGYEAEFWTNPTHETLVEEPGGSQRCKEHSSSNETYERSVFENSEWGSAVMPGVELLE